MLFTIGHGNLSLSAFIDRLRRHRIVTLVDCRATDNVQPWQAHYRRRNLAEELAEHGIAYRHEPRLGGIARSAREGRDLAEMLKEVRTRPGFVEALADLQAKAECENVVALCACSDVTRCHRQLFDRAHHIAPSGALIEEQQESLW